MYKLNRDLLRNQEKRSTNANEAIEKGELLSTDEREACLFAALFHKATVPKGSALHWLDIKFGDFRIRTRVREIRRENLVNKPICIGLPRPILLYMHYGGMRSTEGE